MQFDTKNSNHIALAATLNEARRLFFLEMNGEPTAYLYGSAATGDWCSARSDLDLLIFLKKSQLQLFVDQLSAWKSLCLRPLDGFICIEDDPELHAFGLDAVYDGKRPKAAPLIKIIDPVDLWKVQNRSERLFGESSSLEQMPAVTLDALKEWASTQKNHMWLPMLKRDVYEPPLRNPDAPVLLKHVIYVASTVARIACLIKREEVVSKKEALAFFVESLPKSEAHIELLIENYDESDGESKIITERNSQKISSLCLELLNRP